MTVRRQNVTLYLNCKETHPVNELKKMIEGILKVSPERQVLYKQSVELEDSKALSFYNLNSQTAKAHSPAVLVLAYKDLETGHVEPVNVTPYSTPPELPDVMRGPESAAYSMSFGGLGSVLGGVSGANGATASGSSGGANSGLLSAQASGGQQPGELLSASSGNGAAK